MVSEFVDDPSKREDVEGPCKKAEHDTPPHQGPVELVFEAEESHAQVDEDDALGSEGQRAHEVLHRNLQHGREVEVRVVGHNHSTEQDGHDTCTNKHEVNRMPAHKHDVSRMPAHKQT